DASWQVALGLGFVSAVFDNIPLTALALKEGGYDWGFLAYPVGFGGSMIWFGSSAGVALASQFPAARSGVAGVRGGGHVAGADVAGFAFLVFFLGGHPQPKHRDTLKTVTAPASAPSPTKPDIVHRLNLTSL